MKGRDDGNKRRSRRRKRWEKRERETLYEGDRMVRNGDTDKGRERMQKEGWRGLVREGKWQGKWERQRTARVEISLRIADDPDGRTTTKRR
jgi:hypothetical protein